MWNEAIGMFACFIARSPATHSRNAKRRMLFPMEVKRLVVHVSLVGIV